MVGTFLQVYDILLLYYFLGVEVCWKRKDLVSLKKSFIFQASDLWGFCKSFV